MSKNLSAVEELLALKAEYSAKEAEIRNQALSELREALKIAKNEISEIEYQIAELTGAPVEEKPKGKRLKPIIQGSDEWNKVAGQIAIVLKNHKEGLNGKSVAKALGLTAPNEMKRIQPVLVATARREGEKIATRYFLMK